MKILALETSAKSVSCAVTEDGIVLASAYQCTGLTHSRTLMPMVEDLLKNADLTLGDIDRIAIAAGPGSFTGLRIGIAAVKGLAWAADKPCCAVSTLEAMAQNVRHTDGLIIGAMDARRNQIYNALFEASRGALNRLCADRAIGLDELCEELKGDSRRKIVLGDGGRCIPSDAENCIGQIELRNGRALPEFVRACVKSKVRSVIQFLYDEGGFDASEMLAMPGISCRTVRIPRCRNPFGMCSGACEAMRDLLKGPDFRMPDVFLFTDDHLAQGGLLALMAHGIRIPEDVRVVSLANKGLGPVWVEPVTRLEMDAFAHGAEIAKAVIAFLGGRPFPQGMVLGSAWKRGKTF